MGALRGAPSVIKNPDGTETSTQQGGFVGASGGSGLTGAIKAITGATGGLLSGGGKASMRFAGDALDSKKEDVKSEQESKLSPRSLVGASGGTGIQNAVKAATTGQFGRFSGESLKKMNEEMRNREKLAYDRSLSSLLNPNAIRQQVDQGLISSLPKPLQMMVKGG